MIIGLGLVYVVGVDGTGLVFQNNFAVCIKYTDTKKPLFHCINGEWDCPKGWGYNDTRAAFIPTILQLSARLQAEERTHWMTKRNSQFSAGHCQSVQCKQPFHMKRARVDYSDDLNSRNQLKYGNDKVRLSYY